MKFQNETKVRTWLKQIKPNVFIRVPLFLFFFSIVLSLNDQKGSTLNLSSSLKKQRTTSPSIESRLRVNSEFLLEKIKKIEGQTLRLAGLQGIVEFKIEFHNKLRHTDVFYDVVQDKEFLLYNKKSFLRNRTHYEYVSDKIKIASTEFQVKSSIVESAHFDISMFDHMSYDIKKDDFIDTSLDHLYKQKKYLKVINKKESARKARLLIGSTAPLYPVLFTQSDRTSMLLTPLKKTSSMPTFSLSFDKIKFQTMFGSKSYAHHFELVLEMAEDHAHDSEKQLKSKIVLLRSLTKFLQKQFDLRAPLASRYEMGLESTGMVIP